MITTVKKAVSLRKEQDQKLQQLVKTKRLPYSRILQDALDYYLKHVGLMVMEDQYARYYGISENIKKNKESADEMWALSKDVRKKWE